MILGVNKKKGADGPPPFKGRKERRRDLIAAVATPCGALVHAVMAPAAEFLF